MTHTAGHTADSPLTAAQYDAQFGDPFDAVFGTGIPDTVTPYAGQLWNADGTQLLGTLIPPTEAGGPAQLKIAASGSIVTFPGGTFQTSTGHVVTLSPAGEIQLQAPAGSTPVTGAEVRDIGGGLIGVFDQNGNLIEVRTAPSGPSAPAAPAFSGTQAGIQFQNDLAVAEAKRQEALAAGDLTEARKWEAEVTRIQNEFDAEQNRLAEEGANIRNRLGSLTSLIQSQLAAKTDVFNTLGNLAPDQFKFAAMAGGIAPFGTTPQQGFVSAGQSFLDTPTPQFDPSSLPSIESAIAGLTGVQAPQAPQTFGAPQIQGMAGGGTVPFGSTQVRRVGENGPETMVVDQRGVTILPFDIGAGTPGFQEGGAIGFPFQPIEFQPESLLPALTTSGIFQQGTIPRGNIQADQSIAGFSGGLGFPSNFFNNMGIRPQFFSKFGSPETFFRDPNTPGQFRLVTDTGEGSATGAIQPRSVVQVADTAQFGTLGGTAIGFNELRDQLAQVGGRPSRFTQFSAPLIEPTTGTLLPAPFTVAREMNQLRVTNPTAFNLLLNAYELAGQPASSVLSTIQAALPFGQARGAVGLR